MIRLLWLLFLSACASGGMAPPARRKARVLPSWSCLLVQERVTCTTERGVLTLSVPFVPRAVAARPRGGAFVLGDAGRLARFSSRGRLTGLAETPLRSLASSHDYVCGLDDAGRVHCARDTSRDRVCAGYEVAAFVPASTLPYAQVTVDRGRDAFCLFDHQGRRTCRSARARCNRVCLSFPACATPRCIDPCSSASASRAGATTASSIFLSSGAAAAATLPE